MISQDTNKTKEVNVTNKPQENINLSLAKEIGVEDLVNQGADPLTLSLLIVKLIEERRQANKLLEEMNRKYDEMMFVLKQGKNSQTEKTEEELKKEFFILPEQDRKILDLIELRGKAQANEIQELMHYKGQNGASARMNKLVRDGFLKKVRSGKIVFFIPAK